MKHCLSAGKVLHSHSYRCPEPFSGQTVVVLGAKASGLDISIELVKTGAKVPSAVEFIRTIEPSLELSMSAFSLSDDIIGCLGLNQ